MQKAGNTCFSLVCVVARSCGRAGFIKQEGKQYPLQAEEPKHALSSLLCSGGEQVAAAIKGGSAGCGQDVGDEAIIKSLPLAA